MIVCIQIFLDSCLESLIFMDFFVIDNLKYSINMA